MRAGSHGTAAHLVPGSVHHTGKLRGKKPWYMVTWLGGLAWLLEARQPALLRGGGGPAAAGAAATAAALDGPAPAAAACCCRCTNAAVLSTTASGCLPCAVAACCWHCCCLPCCCLLPLLLKKAVILGAWTAAGLPLNMAMGHEGRPKLLAGLHSSSGVVSMDASEAEVELQELALLLCAPMQPALLVTRAYQALVRHRWRTVLLTCVTAAGQLLVCLLSQCWQLVLAAPAAVEHALLLGLACTCAAALLRHCCPALLPCWS